MKSLVWAFLIGPLFLQAQQQGMTFEKNSTWLEILQKAKAERKYIFVDCLASWCSPCKWMDKYVYSNDTVAKFMDNAFVAVKMQMDTTTGDAGYIRNWYGTAHTLGVQYKIRAYPSFLFFSPDGRAVHKDLGIKNVEEFLALAQTAMDPRRQFYTLLSQYQQGCNDYALIRLLVDAAKELTEDSLSDTIARDYLDNYLTKLARQDIWTNENLAFIGRHRQLIHRQDPLFKMYLTDRRTIDSILGGKGKTNRLINYVVYNDEVFPSVNLGIEGSTEPNWHRIEEKIAKLYGREYVTENLTKGRVVFCKARRQWANYAKFLVRQMEQAKCRSWPAGEANSLILNNCAFEIFKYSNKRRELQMALLWIEHALPMDNIVKANEMDTRANLLYKLGRKQDGLALEEQSHKLAPNDKEIQANYAKMKSGLPTWE
jgi:thioredoxin-related protein